MNTAKPVSTKKKIIYLLGATLLVLSPWIMLFTTILLSKGSISSSHPVWSDELGYWHEILSLSEKGLNFGYYSINEQLPKYLSFGTHGFGTISAYVPYASIFGWNFNSMMLANNLYISLAFILLVVATKPSVKKLLLISVFYLTYMPLVLYCFTSMSELLNYALLIAYFTLLYSYIKAERLKNTLFIILLIFLIYASFVRVIYIVLFLPVLLEKFKVSQFNRNFFRAFGIWIAISAIIYWANSLFTAPYPYSFLAELSKSSSVSEYLYELQKHFFQSIGKFFNIKKDTILQILQRYFIFSVFIIFIFRSNIIKSKQGKWNFPFFSSFLILFLILIINLAAYDIFDWRDYRVVAPVLFGTILFITLAENTSVIKYAIGVNIVILIVFIFVLPSSYRHSVFAKDRYEKVELNEDLTSIKYNPDAKSKFENTVVLRGFEAGITLNIPAGIGISTSFDEKYITDDLKSHYLYSPEEVSLKTYQIIKSSDRGFLYKKID
jgi:hypothetical protein